MLSFKTIAWFSHNFKVYKGYLIPKPPSKPARPEQLYYREQKLKSPDGKITVAKATAMWQKLPNDERASYLTVYSSTTTAYNSNKEEYQRLLDTLKPHGSGYQRFVKQNFGEVRQKFQFLPLGVTMQRLAKLWKELGEEEKKRFQAENEEEKKKKQEKKQSLKELKIPSLKKGKTKEEDMQGHMEEVKKFCEKHGIKVDDLYKLIEKSRIEQEANAQKRKKNMGFDNKKDKKSKKKKKDEESSTSSQEQSSSEQQAKTKQQEEKKNTEQKKTNGKAQPKKKQNKKAQSAKQQTEEKKP